MTDSGQALIDLARRTGTWTASDDVDNLVVPPDLQTLFDVAPGAKAYFDAFPPSAKRSILEWLLNAKSPITRAKRIADIMIKVGRS